MGKEDAEKNNSCAPNVGNKEEAEGTGNAIVLSDQGDTSVFIWNNLLFTSL